PVAVLEVGIEADEHPSWDPRSLRRCLHNPVEGLRRGPAAPAGKPTALKLEQSVIDRSVQAYNRRETQAPVGRGLVDLLVDVSRRDVRHAVPARNVLLVDDAVADLRLSVQGELQFCPRSRQLDLGAVP